MPPALQAVDLYRFYHAGDEETLALRGVSLTVERGELIAVTGPSGSGKSTLLACLAGLDNPDGGSVRVDGELLSRRPEPERARLRARRIGMLFQSNNLLEHFSVAGNIDLAQRLAGRTNPARREQLLDLLGLAERSASHPSELSGGESARAGLAAALANQPTVLLADEPTGEVDHGTAERILRLLQQTARDGAAVVVVTHSDAVAAAADRRVVLSDGQVAS